MKKAISLFLSTALLASTTFAAPVVSKLGKTAFATPVAAGIEQVLGKWNQSPGLIPSVAFYETFPTRNMLNLAGVKVVDRSDDSDAVVLTDYVSLGGKNGGTSLGLRMALAPQESRLAASKAMAESGLIKTGDIIVSTRPQFANSLQYLALQLLNTHISVAVVTEGKVYNIDMPMDGDMLGGTAVGFGKSVMDSPHFTLDNENLMLHILRPRLSESQRQNMQKWFERSLKKAQAKSMYPSSISFNSDYNSPTFRGQGTSKDDISFVADVGRLLIDQKLQSADHLQMFCSEFAWTMLSLRDCNPDTSEKDFKKNKTPSCVSKFFEPMQMFGTGFTTKAGQEQYGMTDGIPMLIQQSGVDAQIANNLIDFAVSGVDKPQNAKGLSSGHKGVATAMAPLIAQTNTYFKLALGLAGAPMEQTEGMRNALNPASPRNYSPTGFSVHAAMPEIAQKKLDYVVSIKYVPKAKLKELQSK
jgi:hypothetical protein